MPPKKLTTITATDLQRKTGQILRSVYIHRESIIVERDGYPVALITPIDKLSSLPNLPAQDEKHDVI